MFSAIYRHNTTKTEKCVKELSIRFLKLKTELKNSSWFVFYCRFCLAGSLKNDSFFWAILPISAYTQDYEWSFTRFISFDTLISNLKSNF